MRCFWFHILFTNNVVYLDTYMFLLMLCFVVCFPLKKRYLNVHCYILQRCRRNGHGLAHELKMSRRNVLKANIAFFTECSKVSHAITQKNKWCVELYFLYIFLFRDFVDNVRWWKKRWIGYRISEGVIII